MNTLAIKSTLGFLNLLLMMGLAIFLPAKTIYFEQAWWYLAIFFGGVIVITVYIFINDKSLLKSRLKVGSVAEQRMAQKVIQGFASVGFMAMYIVSGYDHRYSWTVLPDWVWIFSDGMLVVIMGLLFVIFRKNTYLSATIEVQEHQQVISDGPYALVRHPMYSVALLLFVFTPLSLGSFWALLSLPLMILVLMLRCLDEEIALKKQLAGYEDYCKKVRYHIVPWVW